MSPVPLAITGCGVVSSLGGSAREFITAVLAGMSAIRPLGDMAQDLRFTIGAPVPDFVPGDHFSHRDIGKIDRFTQFAAVAARQAWHEAGFDRHPPALERTAVIIGSANSGIDILNEGFHRIFVHGKGPRPMTIPQTMGSAPASWIAGECQARGPAMGVSSACASAAQAITVGALFLRAGLADVVIAGGSDACFSEGYLRAWDAMRIIASDACRPFSIGRDGLVLGEGAGVLVLERSDHARARGATVLARLLGVGLASDAGGLLQPNAQGMSRAMQLALADAGCVAGDVDYINAHGTGTLANDLAEAQAIQGLFGDRAFAVPVSSTKSMIGHCMGASGALEAVATIGALRAGLLPPTLNFLGTDPEIGFEPIPHSARPADATIALSNSFAFGGLNASLVFGRAEQ